MAKFDYQGAIEAGYSPEEIEQYLIEQQSSSYEKPEKFNENDSFLSKLQKGGSNIAKNFRNFFGNIVNPKAMPEITQEERINEKLIKQNPNFDIQGAMNAGYSPEEINEYLKQNIPEKSLSEKGGRLGAQYLLGVSENALMPYELGVAPLSSKEAQLVPYREEIMNDIEQLELQKQMGQISEDEEKLLENLKEQIGNAEKSMQFIHESDLGIRSIAEKATGLDLQPEGFAEKAVNWIGFIKNPKNILNLRKQGITPKNLIKAISPSGTEALRGLGAGTALEIAEQGNFGPIGTMAAVVAGDLLGAGTAGVGKGIKNLITKPKETIAKGIAKLTGKDKIELQKKLINDFREAGLTVDAGTMTDSNLIKWMQTRIAQSGLTGKAAEEFKHKLTNQIIDEYKQIANGLGEMTYATTHEAGEALKKTLTNIRDLHLEETRNLYKSANKFLNEKSVVETTRLNDTVDKIIKDLTPGKVKSSGQSSVLNILETLKSDISDSVGNPNFANVKSLINNKIALNDIINYEVQGGTKQLLKGVVKDLDRTIISYGKQNPQFAKNYINANRSFSNHSKTFRNKDIAAILKSENPSLMLNKMNTVSGMRKIEEALSKSKEGREVFKNLQRTKFEDVIGKNLVNSTTGQAKFGTFSKLLEKGKNREIIKEILGKDGYKRFQRLQKNAGKIADTADKFYNASKTAAVSADAAILAKCLNDIAHIFYGNPWPLMKTVGTVAATRKLSNLLADPEFLKILEDVILNTEKTGAKNIQNSIVKLKPYFNEFISNSRQNPNSDQIEDNPRSNMQ